MELVDAQMSLHCQLCPEGVFCAQNPCPDGPTTHRELTTAPLSLQLSPSPHHVTVHGADTEVKSLWGVWACGRPGSDGPGSLKVGSHLRPQESFVTGTLELVTRCHSFVPAQ